MPNTFFKSILLVLVLSLSACSDTTNNKDQSKSKVEKKKKFDKPQYDLRLDQHKLGRIWSDTADTDSDSTYNIAVYYDTVLNNNKLAEFWYKRTLKLDSKDKSTMYNLGILYEDEKEFDLAIEWYEKANQLKHDKVLLNLALIYENQMNDHQKAINLYKKAIERVYQL